MRLIEEKDHLRLVEVACLRHHFVKLREHPQQEGGVEQRILEQLCAVQQVNHAAAIFVRCEPVLDVECRLAEEGVGALVLQTQQCTLDSTDALGGDVAVLCFEVGGVVTDVLHHAAQILEVEQQQSLVVSNAEDDAEHAGLRIVELQQAGQKVRSNLGDGCAHRQTFFAINIPEGYRIAAELPLCFQSQLIAQTLLEALAVLAGQAHAGNVALDIGQKNGNAHLAERFCQHLERYCFAGTGGAGDKAVTVGHFGIHINTALVILTEPDFMQLFNIHGSYLLLLTLVGTLAPERMAAFTQGQTVYKARRFLQRHILARFAALEDAERMLAADLAAGKINIFLVFIVAEDKSGEQLFLCDFRHRTLNQYEKYRFRTCAFSRAARRCR